MTEEKTGSDIGRKRMTRREFLRLALIGPPALYVAAKGLEQAFYKYLSLGLTSPGASDKITETALGISEKAHDSENPKFRPMAEIIRQGIDGHKGPVIYVRSKDYRDTSYYAKTIDRITSFPLTIRNPREIIEEFKKAMPHEAYQAYLQGEYVGNTGFENYFPPGSGYYERFKKGHPELIRADGYVESYDRLFEEMRKEGKAEMNEMGELVEDARNKNDGQPVSSSIILSRFLEKNEGDLSSSIFDTALFLKFMARNDSNTGVFNPGETNVSWLNENILDEYQGPSYMFPPQEESTINLIGKPYHSWNLVALLKFFPNEVVRAGGLYQQLGALGEQGLGKTRSDLQTLDDLRETESLLLQYSPGK